MLQETPNMDALANAFLQSATDEPLIVKAEDLPTDSSGIDYSKIFFEPRVGESYTIKFITNPFGQKITHRGVYKSLPDPKRKGKTFQYVSSGSAKTCKVLELFFELHEKKKSGDALAIKKIDEFLGKKNQACAIIQIHSSPVAEEIGLYRLFTFSTFGPNPTIANLIDGASNPTEAQIREGEVKEDLFDIFDSIALIIQCEEADFEGIKGRDYGKSSWSKKRRGAYIEYENAAGEKVKYEFNKTDMLNTPEAKEAFQALIKKLSEPELSIHNYFAYKPLGHEKTDENTEKYLVEVNAKVDEIVPIIRNAQSIAEIKQYGIVVPENTTSDSAQLIGGAKASDILKDSVPSELAASIMNDGPAQTETPAASSPVETPAVSSPAISGNADVADILASN